MCFDVDASKIAKLRRGELPIFEPGLDSIVERNSKAGRLRFSTDVEEATDFGELQFIAVGTPPDENGHADLKHVLAAAAAIGRHMKQSKIIVDKSTVPVGTVDRVRSAIEAAQRARGVRFDFHVVSNPEFLKEGAAVEDFMRPDRIIVGSSDAQAIEVMRALYAPLQRSHERIIVMDARSAELTKYAANAMLATRISFMNELALLAEKLGADIENVRRGIGSDPRIGFHFLYPGCGYGGSCFPKDVQALQRSAQEHDTDLAIIAAVEAANNRQKRVLLDKIEARFGCDLSGKTFALWGLAFKPETDDMREAPSRVVIDGLIARGARVVAYDPVAAEEAKRIYSNEASLSVSQEPLAALYDSDALVIVTEWKEFRSPDFDAMRKMLRLPVIFDGRNLYDPQRMRDLGFDYYPIGRLAPAVAARTDNRFRQPHLGISRATSPQDAVA
jgi:UDPglucose 6-dehydrogenase